VEQNTLKYSNFELLSLLSTKHTTNQSKSFTHCHILHNTCEHSGHIFVKLYYQKYIGK